MSSSSSSPLSRPSKVCDVAAIHHACKVNPAMYTTPQLNDTFILSANGFTHVDADALQHFPHCKVLFLNDNALIELPDTSFAMPQLTALYLHNNALTSVSALTSAIDVSRRLTILNLSRNALRSVRELSAELIPNVTSLDLSHNALTQVDSLRHCTALVDVNVSHNAIADGDALIATVSSLKALRVLYTKNNPFADSFGSYRRRIIASLLPIALTYLDDRPVTDDERLAVAAWSVGGVDGERLERVRQSDVRRLKDERNMAEWKKQRAAGGGTLFTTQRNCRIPKRRAEWNNTYTGGRGRYARRVGVGVGVGIGIGIGGRLGEERRRSFTGGKVVRSIGAGADAY